MRYWDSSAIVPLLVHEEWSSLVTDWYRADASILTWWGTELECVSALVRREREGVLTGPLLDVAFDRLSILARSWHEIQPVDAVRTTARRLLRVHPLRAADAAQLAAALIAAGHDPRAFEVVTFDGQLAAAARREGFAILSAPVAGG